MDLSVLENLWQIFFNYWPIRDQIANIHQIMEKAREFQKNIYFCFIDYAKPLTFWITINGGTLLKR